MTTADQQPHGIQHSVFAVGDEPHCVWAWDLAGRNLHFIEGIDGGYFEYIADTHQEHLDTDHAQRAAVALRANYHLSLETLFSLMAAALQAPDCAIGWVLKARTEQLRAIVQSLSKGAMKFPVPWPLASPFGFDETAQLIFQYTTWPRERDGTVERFAMLWKRLAVDFLDPYAIAEYNALKHGLRARAGGFSLRAGHEHQRGVRPPEEEMGKWMGSVFGTSFHAAELIGIRPARDPHFTLRRHSLNWLPYNTAGRMLLAAMSIENIQSFLAVENSRKPSETTFQRPMDPSDFDRPWEQSPGVTGLNIDNVVGEGDIHRVSKDELRRILLSRSALLAED